MTGILHVAVIVLLAMACGAVSGLIFHLTKPVTVGGRRPLKVSRVDGRIKIHRAVDPARVAELERETGLVDDTAPYASIASILENFGKEPPGRQWQREWERRQAKPVDLSRHHLPPARGSSMMGATVYGGTMSAGPSSRSVRSYDAVVLPAGWQLHRIARQEDRLDSLAQQAERNERRVAQLS